MHSLWKRLLSVILTIAVVLSFSITAFAKADDTEGKELTEEDYETADIIFDELYALTNQMNQRNGLSDQLTQQICDYLNESDEVEDGSVEINGETRITWKTEEGIACAYSPRMQDIMNSAEAPAEEDTDEDVQIISYQQSRGLQHGRDVYLIEPYYGIDSSFTKQYQNEAARIAEATEGTYRLYKGEAATIDAIADSLEKGGLIIFDSHGDTDYSGTNGDYTSGATTSYLCLQSGEGLTTEDYKNKHALYAGQSGQMKVYEVDGTAISNHMDEDGNNGLLWMAICLGMATDGLASPLRNKGIGVVYGYSRSVSFGGDYCFEEAFFNSMLGGNTVAQSIIDMKDTYGSWDYSPQICSKCGWPTSYVAADENAARQKKAAFPIVVSDEDVYPGHGNVDAVQEVHSAWSLLSSYELTVNADAEGGSVTTKGMTITAAPQDGYYASGYSLEPEGAATVQQQGNTFRVSAMRENCAITIHFAQKTAAVVSFVVPNGVTQANYNDYVGEAFTLPTPTGTPDADAQGYHFVGWTEKPVTTPADAVEFYRAGESHHISSESVTLYALYEYFETPEGKTPAFNVVDASKEDWSGFYVITDGAHALLCDGSQTGSDMGGTDAAVGLNAAGIIANGSSLSGVSRAYTVQIVRVPNSQQYAIRLGDSGIPLYLACRTNSDQLNTAADYSNTYARWNISYENGHAVLQNARYAARSLQFCESGQYFRCVEETETPLTLYSAEAFDVWYTTNPSDVPLESVSTPTISPNGGEFTGSRSVTITCGTEGADIYYTIDGSIPMSSSTKYSGAITLDSSATVKAIGVKNEMKNSEMATAVFTKVEAPKSVSIPVISPNGGEFTGSRSVTLTCGTGGADIYYTIDGSTPTTGSTKYNGAITLSSSATVKAIAVKSGMTNSAMATAAFTKVEAPKSVSIPVISPNGGEFTGSRSVTLTCGTEGADIYYTIDGSTPTTNSMKYNGAITLSSSATVKAIAVKSGMTNSTIATAVFTKSSGASSSSGGGGGGGGAVQSGKLTFNTNEGGSIIPVSTKVGSVVDLTEYKPTRDGYVFEGWYSDAAFKNRITSIKLTANTTIYAKWTEKSAEPEKSVEPVKSVEPEKSTPVKLSFTDVPENAYYKNAVEWAIEGGVAHGISDSAFGPDNTGTRAQAMTFLWHAMGSPEPTATTCPFTDISSSDYYYKAVLWAVENGITGGTSATTFTPDSTVTRGQILTFQWNVDGKKTVKSASTNPFADVSADAYYSNAVAWAVEEGITDGTSATTFSPDTPCTRGQIVTFLYRQVAKK